MKKERKLKIFNGKDWNSRGGHCYVAAYSWNDVALLYCQARNKVEGYHIEIDDKEIARVVRYLREYWSPGCWGDDMNGVTPERGVWHGKSTGTGFSEKPVRVI